MSSGPHAIAGHRGVWLRALISALYPRPGAPFDQTRHVQIGLRLPSGLHIVQSPILVSPADYFELRALTIAKQEIAVLADVPPGFEPGPRTLRLWPFRWPAHEPKSLIPEPPPEPEPEVGRYLDLLF
ncbi:MAG: hypothetical protein ACE5E1_04105 [Phycisphaerae bacterium]